MSNKKSISKISNNQSRGMKIWVQHLVEDIWLSPYAVWPPSNNSSMLDTEDCRTEDEYLGGRHTNFGVERPDGVFDRYVLLVDSTVPEQRVLKFNTNIGGDGSLPAYSGFEPLPTDSGPVRKKSDITLPLDIFEIEVENIDGDIVIWVIGDLSTGDPIS